MGPKMSKDKNCVLTIIVCNWFSGYGAQNDLQDNFTENYGGEKIKELNGKPLGDLCSELVESWFECFEFKKMGNEFMDGMMQEIIDEIPSIIIDNLASGLNGFVCDFIRDEIDNKRFSFELIDNEIIINDFFGDMVQACFDYLEESIPQTDEDLDLNDYIGSWYAINKNHEYMENVKSLWPVFCRELVEKINNDENWFPNPENIDYEYYFYNELNNRIE